MQTVGDLTSPLSGLSLNESNPLAFHDQRPPMTPIQHQRSKVVSTGCFQNSFLLSFFGFFRRRSANDHEVTVPISSSFLFSP